MNNVFYIRGKEYRDCNSRLAHLAKQFRGNRDGDSRKKVAIEYAKEVDRLIATGKWNYAPNFDEMLTDEYMPANFKEYWSKPHDVEDDVEDVTSTRKANNFKVGDKVYVLPGRPLETRMTHYIRATITGIYTDSGYHLRAFKQDLPGIWMFNVWDDELLPRTNMSKKRL